VTTAEWQDSHYDDGLPANSLASEESNLNIGSQCSACNTTIHDAIATKPTGHTEARIWTFWISPS